MEVEVYFSPDGGCGSIIEKEIDNAKKQIVVAMYSLTSSPLSWALVRSVKRGVDVMVVLDAGEAQNDFSKIEFFKKKGVKVKQDLYLLKKHKERFEKMFPPKMHHKFAVIDGRVVITGSYNWTASAEKNNYEDCLIFSNAEKLADRYLKRFKELWERN